MSVVSREEEGLDANSRCGFGEFHLGTFPLIFTLTLILQQLERAGLTFCPPACCGLGLGLRCFLSLLPKYADGKYQYMEVVDFAQGFGAVQLAAGLPTKASSVGAFFHDHSLESDARFYYSIYVDDPSKDLSSTVAWYDPPSSVSSYNVSTGLSLGWSCPYVDRPLLCNSPTPSNG